MKLSEIANLEENDALEYETKEDENVVDLETKRQTEVEKRKAERLETLRTIHRRIQAQKQA